MHPDLLHGLARAQSRQHLRHAEERRLASTARAHGQKCARLSFRFAWLSHALARRKLAPRVTTTFPGPRYAARHVSRN